MEISRTHREFDILLLQLAQAVDLGVVALFWKALEIFRGQLFGGGALFGDFLADKRVSWHGAIKMLRAGRRASVQARRVLYC
jgi:hypothetical protein